LDIWKGFFIFVLLLFYYLKKKEMKLYKGVIVDASWASCSCGSTTCGDAEFGTGQAKISVQSLEFETEIFLPFMDRMGASPYYDGQEIEIAIADDDIEIENDIIFTQLPEDVD
jgi:hypothetical protein